MVKHFNDLVASRRALLGGLAGLPLLNLSGCATGSPGATTAPAQPPGFASVAATNVDTISLPPGYRWSKLIAWGDALHEGMPAFDPDALTRADQERRFGQNNDMLALFPATYAFPPDTRQDRMLLCANHEYFDPSLMFPAMQAPRDLNAAQVEAALAATGISVVALERVDGAWRVARDADASAGLNRRITPFSPMVFSGPAAEHPWIRAAAAGFNANEPGEGGVRCGTFANCAGGQTPWGTYLSSEENFNNLFALSDDGAAAYREAVSDNSYVLDTASFGLPGGGSVARLAPSQFDMAHNPHGPALYGWVVEVDPYDPAWTPRKRTALGRKKGECATTALARDGRVAIYMGDDQIDEFVYKFVSAGRFDPNARTANRDLLDHGQLHVARFEEDGSGTWMPITIAAANEAARAAEYSAAFADEGDLAIRVREAARLMGATPMDRPEDVEAVLDANWTGLGPVLIVCTNNREQGFAHPGNPRRDSPRPNSAQSNPAGHIVRIDEAGGDAGATRFSWDVFLLAGDPDSAELVTRSRAGLPQHISTVRAGESTFSGDRFACPDNLCIDSGHNVWISTDGSDAVFADCNDSVLVTPAAGSPVVKRFLVGPLGAEICGPTMAPDERAFFAAIQHPGESDAAGTAFSETRWRGQRPYSSFPDGGESWPRSAVIVVTREDGGKIGG